MPHDLPSIPGDWTEIAMELGGREFKLLIPGQPDLFLDDPAVLEANRVNDYMPYWSYLWPAAPPMSRAILERAPWPVASSVLELGSGVGLVGLACQSRGDHVTYSDYDSTALQVCRFNAQRNGFPTPRTLLLDWREPVAETFPVIVGCEVTYDEQLHQPLLNAIKSTLRPQGICWLGDPGRYQSPRFYQAAINSGFQVLIYDEQGFRQETPLANQFQLMELTLA